MKTEMFGSADEIYQLRFRRMIVRGVIDVAEVRFEDKLPVEFGE